jgi:hypothetical protein
MNRSFIIVFFILCISACNQKEKNNVQSGNTDRYSPAINQAIDSSLNKYYALSETLVQWDSSSVDSAAKIFVESLDQLSLNLDTVTGTRRNSLLEGNAFFVLATNSANEMISAADLTAKRHRFHDLSDNLFLFLDAIEYEHKPVYLQECTMPFNDTGRGVWLSNSEEKRNPYLGLHHPYYKAGMLECGTLEKKLGSTTKEN